MTSNRWVRAFVIVAAGTCLALGAGHGVAAAESDSADGGAGAGSSSQSAESSQSAHGSQASPGDALAGPKSVDKSQDSAAGPKSVDKPTTTVSASTVTVDRDGTVTSVTSATSTSEPAPQVTSVSAKSAKHATTAAATPVARPTEQAQAAAPEPVTAPEAAPTAVEVVSTSVALTVEVASPQPNPVKEAVKEVVAQDATEPVVLTAPPAAAKAELVPATDVATNTAATRSLAAPVAHAPPAGPLATVVISLLSAFGVLPPTPAVPVPVVGTPAQTVPGTSSISGVTGVKVGSSDIQIPVGSTTYTGAADWYFPTQADGTVQAQGVMWLQHGFLGSKSWYSALAQQLAQQTNSIVVVPNIPSFPFFTCSGCTLSDVAIQEGVATLFADPNRTALNLSAGAAGYQGTLPENFILAGHSAGGGLAAAAGGFYADAVAPADNHLLGVVMFDGVSSNGTFAPALASLDALDIPVYQIAAPPQPWNANGQTTNDLVALRPNQFVGAVLANGSHVDSLIGGAPIIDVISQLLIRPSTPGNTQAVYTLATGWINDLYAGRGPADPLYGIYGQPDQYLVLGQTAAVVLGPAPVVDVNRYLGTWYEVGSVKQFFSIGLVNTTAVYSLNPDGSIRVENSGNYFVDNGPESTIVGAAVPLDPTNAKLNVTFYAPASATPPGNYWIVDLAPDYSWAIVSDPTGYSGFLLSRTRTVSAELYQQLLDRASVKGVTGGITPTPQPAAGMAPVTV